MLLAPHQACRYSPLETISDSLLQGGVEGRVGLSLAESLHTDYLVGWAGLGWAGLGHDPLRPFCCPTFTARNIFREGGAAVWCGALRDSPSLGVLRSRHPQPSQEANTPPAPAALYLGPSIQHPARWTSAAGPTRGFLAAA